MSEAIAFRTQGSEGRHCLLLHGFGSDRLSWLGTTPFLPKPLVIHTLDLPGHGESGTDVGDGSPQELAGRLAGILDQRGLAGLHVIGHSLGGGLAMMLAADRPDLVSELCLIAPAGLGEGVDTAFLAAFPEARDAETITRLLQQLVVRPQLMGRQIADRVLQQLDRAGARAALARIADGIATQEDQMRRAAVRVAASGLPRSIMWGAKDRINPPDMASLAAFGGDLHMIADAGHLPHIEAARQANALLADMLGTAGA